MGCGVWGGENEGEKGAWKNVNGKEFRALTSRNMGSAIRWFVTVFPLARTAV